MHKWHDESETYTKEEMANKKIFADQLDIAMRLSGLDSKSKDEFVADYERTYGKIVTETKFPNILQIIDKFSKFDSKKDQSIEHKTPNKVSHKGQKLEAEQKIQKGLEETKSPYDLSSSEKPKAAKQQELQHKTHLEIENKIQEANTMAMNREEMALSKNKLKLQHPYSKIMK